MTLPIIALDGEGYTKRSGAHLYTYVAASTEKHLVSDFYNPRGIATSELFDWLLSLPRAHLLVGYSLGYDRCKWLEGLPDAMIHALHRPELRARPETAGAPPMPIRWKNRYNVNLLSTRLDVSRPGVKHSARTVWDVFKFFQCSFVKALRAWGIGTPAEVARIEAMKARRGNFTRIGPRERRYCQEECKLLAALVRELAQVHESEGLELRTFYGPGSTASLVLGRCGAEEQTRAQKKAQDKKRGGGKALRFAIACSYFGGRFECSHVGPVPGPLYSYDIASAYPYALAQLPCLAHGRWKHVIDPVGIANALSAGVACISYRIDAVAGAPQAWGPLPHRMPQKVKTAEGKKLLKAIVFPVSSAGGWAWSVELRAARKLHPGIALLEAWVWEPTCKHAPPFRAEVVRLFLRRLQVGKGTRGIVLKLALNSMYGKSAQSVGGGGKFRCMVRAGIVTATTRAMLLEAVMQARSKWNILELATDSVLSREQLDLPGPLSLGTEAEALRAGKAALGAWEEKPWKGGVMLLRPGLRFPLRKSAKIDQTAARGLGVRVLHASRAAVYRAWQKAPGAPVGVQQPPTFHGCKSSVWKRKDGTYVRSPLYGRWEAPTARALNYEPGPKRARTAAAADPRGPLALLPWALPQVPGARSHPYKHVGVEAVEDALEDEQPEHGMMGLRAALGGTSQ